MSRKKRKPTNKKEVVKKKSGIEEKVEKLIEKFDISYTDQACLGKYTVDFLVDDKYIIECYGDFWHCNPTKYTGSFFNKGSKKTAQEIWERDKKRKDELEKMGYKFLCLWESEINAATKLVYSKIKKFINPK
jgi:G:T-mismatch repair DNA endonuclease (very short patch repair protein)